MVWNENDCLQFFYFFLTGYTFTIVDCLQLNIYIQIIFLTTLLHVTEFVLAVAAVTTFNVSAD
jgi:hypothetical protein